jgi:hypothetical protein
VMAIRVGWVLLRVLETFGHGFESHRQLPVRMPEIRCQMPDTLDSGI